jgi:hypothetical protein
LQDAGKYNKPALANLSFSKIEVMLVCCFSLALRGFIFLFLQSLTQNDFSKSPPTSITITAAINNNGPGTKIRAEARTPNEEAGGTPALPIFAGG